MNKIFFLVITLLSSLSLSIMNASQPFQGCAAQAISAAQIQNQHAQAYVYKDESWDDLKARAEKYAQDDVVQYHIKKKHNDLLIDYATANMYTQMQSLIIHGAEANYKNGFAVTPLMIICATETPGNLQQLAATVKLLIAHNADIKVKNPMGWTPFMCCAFYGHYDALMAILPKLSERENAEELKAAKKLAQSSSLSKPYSKRKGFTMILQALDKLK